MDKKYILSIDQGTTSSRAILFNKEGVSCGVSQQEFGQIFPDDGWVEHDPNEIWETTKAVCKDVLSENNVDANEIAAIGITNQRETTIVWDKSTGKPIYNAIVWQDRRTADFCKDLKGQGHEALFQEKTGLLLDPYFSGTKIRWILDHVEGARQKAEQGDLAFGTVECFLLWHLTGGKSHKTDVTNASRTLLFNIQTGQWDKELLDILGVPESMLPEACPNMDDFGMSDVSLFGKEIPVTGMIGDQQAAAFGQACFEPGMVKSTYGTGCFVLKNIGTTYKKSDNKLLTTIAYQISKDQPITYAIEGSIFIAGAAIQFLRDGLGLLKHASESEAMARSLSGNDGVYFVPALSGLGAPYWDPHARGVITGLTRATTKEHLVRAALEAQAYQTRDLFRAMKSDSGYDIETIRVDGGLVNNDWVCEFLAGMTGADVDRPMITETTALGAAFMAGIHVGFYDSLETVKQVWKLDQKFKPLMDAPQRDKLYEGWLKSVEKAKG